MTNRKEVKNRANDIDRIVAANLRNYAIIKGISTKEMADKLKVSQQQVMKYKNCINRISSGTLYKIAKILDVDINTFYNTKSEVRELLSIEQSINTNQTILLAKYFNMIENEKIRHNIIDLIRNLQ